MRYLKIILLTSFTLILFLLRFSIAQAVTVTDLRFWTGPDHTRIVLDLTEPIEYESSSQETPPQFHLELKKATVSTPNREIIVTDPFITKITLMVLEQDKAKLILHQKQPLKANVFLLKPYLDKPHRLVIDLVDVAQEKKEVEEREKQKEIMPQGTKIVVIDPGHGGEDPGAMGKKKTMEKDVVLKIGKKLVELLNRNKEIQAFLTRKGDYFIPLEERGRIARQYKADLFISLHADANFNTKARGSSIYCLSLTGATDEAARLLADKENLSNVLGGITSRSSASEADDLNPIFLDLTQHNTMQESIRFAEILTKCIKQVNPLKYSSYRQAGFIVLKAPDIPSVLVETAFITNKEDERLLNNGAFQENIAQAIHLAVKQYFRP